MNRRSRQTIGRGLLAVGGAVTLAALLLSQFAADRGPLAERVSAAPVQVRSLQDGVGHRIRVPAEVRSVGTPGISMASLIVALGAGNKLKALTPEVRVNPWLRRAMPGVSTVATPFSRPAGVNLEALLRVRPDLAVLWAGSLPLGESLGRIGVPVFYLGYASPAQMQAQVRLLGQALGPAEAARAETFVRYYQDNLKRVATRLADLPESARPGVYYTSVSALRTEGRGSMVDAWIAAAGGTNVAARAGIGDDAQIRIEDLLVWDPQIVVVMKPATRDAILTDPRWKTVRAVREGRVLVNPAGINAWCTRAAEAALQVLWAAQSFHPTRFADLDIGAETRHFYRIFYNLELTDDELARVMRGLPPADNQFSNPTGGAPRF